MSDTTYTPSDDFPPHGYLDNPHHSWKRNPSGVLRSRVSMGMGWHFPNYGSYGRNQFAYRAHLHVGLELVGQRLLTPAELAASGVVVGCDRHTKSRLRYTLAHPAGARFSAEYFLVDEDALGCRIEVHRNGARVGHTQTARLWLAMEIAHNPATSRAWEHSLYTTLPNEGEPSIGAAGLIGVCPEGDAWALGVAYGGTQLLPSATTLLGQPWLMDKWSNAHRDPREPEGLQTATLLLAYDLVDNLALPQGDEPLRLDAVLARGVSPDAATVALHDALSSGFDAAYHIHENDDERFWATAPRLAGDWPDAWRRGFATDLETLRMVTRSPAGVFATRWDGMQIQAPRIVLAEAALDAITFGWADPQAARELLLTCFTSAQRPNVPCMREDGSYNMIADDGAICGTGPEWGWPFAAIDALWRRGGDDAWLGAILPGASAYLDWWHVNRSDDAGWLVHACSWESGQDVSTRFGQQSTGGSDTRHLRPVDLQAAAAQAYRLLGVWSDALGRDDEQREQWREAYVSLAGRTREMWRGNWFRDFDARRSRWSDVRDPMQLAPLACGLATPEQHDALRGTFAALPPHAGAYPAMVWPPVALTVLDAALAAGLDERAGELTAAICERVWRRMDSRECETDGALPGVTREYWPEPDQHGALPSAGIEGYGWGALTVHLLIRYILGLREESADAFRLVPALPQALRRPGVRYTVGPLAYAGGHVTITYTLPSPPVADAIDVTLALDGLPGTWVTRDEQDGREQDGREQDGREQDGRELARCVVTDRGSGELTWRGAHLRPVTVRRERDAL